MGQESTECNIMPPNYLHFMNINEIINDVMTKNNGIPNPTYRNKVLRRNTSLHAHTYIQIQIHTQCIHSDSYSYT